MLVMAYLWNMFGIEDGFSPNSLSVRDKGLSNIVFGVSMQELESQLYIL